MAYETEEEQIEAIRRWWQENGRSVIAGVVIAIAGVVGWQQWQAWQERQALSAASQYNTLAARISADRPDDALKVADALHADASGSPYAAMGSLRLGRYFADRGEYGAAADQLRWVLDNVETQALQQVARLRLAQVLEADGQREAALEVLKPVPEGAFAGRFHELTGDLLAAAGRREEANAAYQAALETSDLASQRRSYVELKLSDLGGPAPGETS